MGPAAVGPLDRAGGEAQRSAALVSRRSAEEPAESAALPSFERLTPEEGEAVHGQVVDDASGFPLASLSFQVKPSGRPAVPVRTDADGRFVTAGPVRFGEVQVRHSDPTVGFTRPWIAHDAPGASAAASPLRLRSGPAFLVRPYRSGGVEGLALTARLRAFFETGLVQDDREARLGPATDARPAWAFFVPRARERVEKARLELRDESGSWVGAANVDDAPGPHGSELAIELVPAGGLFGTALRPGGAPVANELVRAIAVVEPGSGTDDPVLYALAGIDRTGPDGEWAIEGLVPGPHLVVFQDYGTDPFARRVDVRPGVRSHVSVEPVPASAADLVLAGRVRWPAEREPPHTRIELRRTWPHASLEAAWIHRNRDRDTTETLRWRRGPDGWEAEFRLDGLTAGEYRLRPEAGPFGFEPPEALVAPSAWDVDFTCRAGELRDLTIRVVDSVTGAAVEGASFSRAGGFAEFLDGLQLASIHLGGGEIRIQDVPDAVEWNGLVHARGYRSAVLDQDSFAGGRTELTVPLDPSGLEEPQGCFRMTTGRLRIRLDAGAEDAGSVPWILVEPENETPGDQ